MPGDSTTLLASLPRSPGRRILRREEAQNWIDGYRFIEHARGVADSLSHSAQAAREEARMRGLEEGRQAGEAQAAAIVTETVARVDRYLASIEAQVAELAISIVERVLGRLPISEIVAEAAKEAVQSFRRERYLKVRVSPHVVEDVRRALSTWSEARGDGPTLIVEADEQLAGRQCIIVTEFAVMDASVDTQLSTIRQTLTGDAGAVSGT